jgi:hypothetical protein
MHGHMNVKAVAVFFFLNLDVRWVWVVNATSRSLFPREKNTIPILQEVGCGKFRSYRNSIKDRPARSDWR